MKFEIPSDENLIWLLTRASSDPCRNTRPLNDPATSGKFHKRSRDLGVNGAWVKCHTAI